MPLTPVEILRRRFRRTLFGYSVKEIHRFIKEVSEALAYLLDENNRLQEEVERLRLQLQDYQNLEQHIRDALVLAEKAADDAKKLAQKEAELIVSQARMEAQRLKQQAMETEQLKARLEAEVRALIHSYLALLDRRSAGDPDS
ncbi:MAG: DivIVA domain-containing protein [Armatimonadetes bacterium]|nr:DivIVA domain-containing protein [Armatimonadota bacterium]MDW8121216.1 DivIVA domain-containing protein [Armatimonadota bacterium]